MNFQRWALIGVVLPFVLLVLLRFVFAPFIWDDYVAAKGTSLLVIIFMIYLAGLTVFAAFRKWRIEHKSLDKQK